MSVFFKNQKQIFFYTENDHKSTIHSVTRKAGQGTNLVWHLTGAATK